MPVKTPMQMFPNLFGQQSAPQAPAAASAFDLRLVQYSMRQAAVRRLASRTSAPNRWNQG
jgi:hypothetical protein